MENRERICRFCFDECDTNFKAIERGTHDILNMLLVTTNLAISDEPVMCTNCSEILQNCFVFKKTCLDIRDHSNVCDNDKNNDHAVCEFCMNLMKNCSFTIPEDIISQKAMLEKHFPELDVSASKKPVICQVCYESLVNFIDFVTTSSIAEEKIKKYCEAEGVNNRDSIKLNNVVQFTSKNVWKENDLFKIEGTISVKFENEKMKFQEGICTLCLEKCENYKAVDESTKNILDVLLPKLDFTVIQGPVMCKNCEELLMKCFDFKATCLRNHNYIVQFLNKDNVTLNLKDVYLNRNVTGTDVPEDQDRCGFCMGPLKDPTVSIMVEKDVMLKKMIEACLPELELSIIKEPKICISCHGSLKDCFHFVRNCLIVEEIKKFCETPNINSECQIDLNSSLQFVTTDVITREVDGNSADIIKVEEQFWEDRNNPDDRDIGNGENAVKLKQSFMEMNEQEVNDEQQFTPKNILACAGESNKLDSIKIEGIFYGESESKFNEENRVEMENQIFLPKEEIEIKTEQDFNRFEDGIILSQSEVTSTLHRTEICPAMNLERDLLNPFKKHSLTKKCVSEVTMHKCKFCSFQAKYETSLENHNLIHEGFKKHVLACKDSSEITVYKCDTCSYQTKNKYNLKIHLLKHKNPSELTMYKCDSCSYKTKHKRYLKDHLLTHKDPSELTMHKCGSCSFQTKYRVNLKIHLLTHMGPSDITMHKCDYCSYQTKYKNSLKLHNIMTHNDPPQLTMYECATCFFQSKRKNQLKKHLRLHKNTLRVIKYKCTICSFQTYEEKRLRSHLLVHENPSEVTMYKCDYCSFQTEYSGSLNNHLLTHKDPSQVPYKFKCDSCSFQTKLKHNLKKHLILHKNPSEVPVYKCASCSFQAIEKARLIRHLIVHKDPSEITMYKCDTCSFQTKHKYCLINHFLKHKDPSEVTMYKCDSCSFETKIKASLKSHLLKHKDPSEVTMHKCDYCPFQTKQKNSINNHLLTHKDPSEVTMYKCNSCSFESKHKPNLKLHLLTHKDPLEVTMYKCDSCSFQAKHKSSLRSHLRNHKVPTEVKVYKCDYCSFQTKHKSSLRRHLRNHKVPTEVKVYKCDYCSFQTKHKYYLNSHSMTHMDPSEVKMYKCGKCSYQAKQKSYLRKHLLMHKDPLEITMYKCASCSFQAKRKGNLKSHLLTHKDH